MKIKTSQNGSNTGIIQKWVVAFLLLGATALTAQIKIGDNPENINASSVLELESTTKALVLSRLTNAQMQVITPLPGALVYNLDEQCVFYYNGTLWSNLCSGSGGISFSDNGDGSITFTNEVGDSTTISSAGGSSIAGTQGSVFFADADGSSFENNGQLFWDNTNNRLGIGSNTNLTNKLTVAGTLGLANGIATAPALRFTDDGDTGIYRNTENELAFSVAGAEKMRVNTNSLALNAAAPFNQHPLVIRASDNSEVMAFQFRTGVTQWHIDLNGPGLNFIETNIRNNRLFFQNNGGLGVETGNPTETLDVNGTLRIRNLPPSTGGQSGVTVDANGVFHKSALLSGKSVANSIAARWANSSSSILETGTNTAPIFENDHFVDGGSTVYEIVKGNLQLKEPGLYDIKATISLIGTALSPDSEEPTQTYARLVLNGIPMGALNTAATNGKVDNNTRSSISITELLRLKQNDILSIAIDTDAQTGAVRYNSEGTCVFTINKLD